MRLSRLIADFRLAETRLIHSIEREVSVRTRVTLMHRTTALMDGIENHSPESADEMRTKIAFFMSRAQRNRNRRELQIALDLIALSESGQSRHSPCESRSARPFEVLDRLVARGVSAGCLTDYVANLPERASVLDSGFRHLCTSSGNQKFHAMAADRFTNLHVGDLIGAKRYLERGRDHMNAALSGRNHAYYYALDVPTLGTRVMQCALRRWQKPSGETAGLALWVRDVTEQLGARHGFGEVPFALPDAGFH